MRPGPEANLRDLEAPAFAEQNVLLRHPTLLKRRCMWPRGAWSWPNTCIGPMISTPGVSFGTRICDCCLLGGASGIGLHHHDHDLATGIAEAGDVVFLSVDDPFVTDKLCRGRDVLGIRRGDIGLGHGIGGADFAGQQRLQPLLLLLAGADALQHLHVAGVRRRAVHGLRGQRVLAEFDRDIGIVEIFQALAGLGIGQEEIPQAFFLGLCLGLVQHLELAGGKAPAIGLASRPSR